jgi:hypothetical protein
MAAKRERQPAAGGEGAEHRPVIAAPGDLDDAERYGPLRVERHAKADGRALLLYSLASRPSPPQR